VTALVVGCLLDVVAVVGAILDDVLILVYNFRCRYLSRSALCAVVPVVL
jgi:hypothetical protein